MKKAEACSVLGTFLSVSNTKHLPHQGPVFVSGQGPPPAWPQFLPLKVPQVACSKVWGGVEVGSREGRELPGFLTSLALKEGICCLCSVSDLSVLERPRGLNQEGGRDASREVFLSSKIVPAPKTSKKGNLVWVVFHSFTQGSLDIFFSRNIRATVDTFVGQRPATRARSFL